MIDSSSGRDLQYSLDSMSSEDLESESIVTVFGRDLVMSRTCGAASMAVSSAVRIGLGDSFREMEVLTASRYTPAPVLPSSRTDPSV